MHTLIYLITNKITNKQYVGKTKKNIESRLEEHCRLGQRGINRELSVALRNYGLFNFDIKLIEEVENDKSIEREDHYIKKYNTLWPNGYNMRFEIKMQTPLELDEKDNLIKNKNIENGIVWNKNINMTKYIGEKISNTIKEKKESGWINRGWGHKHTEETKKLISQKKKYFYKNNRIHNMKCWKITKENEEFIVDNLQEFLGGKMKYNRITKWSRENEYPKLHKKLLMRVDHAD